MQSCSGVDCRKALAFCERGKIAEALYSCDGKRGILHETFTVRLQMVVITVSGYLKIGMVFTDAQ